VHERQVWEAFNYTLFQSLAVSGEHWVVLWCYCQEGSLDWVYFEAADGSPLALDGATGVCDESALASTVEASFPAVDLPVPELVAGFTVTGTDVFIEGAAPGWLRVGTREYDVYLFNHIDCTEECGAPGWHELHALLWDREREWLCFSIFYLFEDRPVQLSYSFSLPSLVAPFAGLQLGDATWTAP
jgi:hypothetical protein